MKNDLESRLKEMPMAKPSARLRERIFAEIPEAQRPESKALELGGGRRRTGSIFRARIPLGWAAAAAVLMGVAGFLTARHVAGPVQTSAPRGSTTVEVRIVEIPAGQRHFFDFTGTTDDFLPADSKLRIETGGNV